MATTYRLSLAASSGEVTSITIEDSFNILPGSDIWKADDPGAFDMDGGNVADWATNTTHLHGLGAAPVITLEQFTKAAKVGDSGSGESFATGGSFPGGRFRWRCQNRS